jgi:hypothetical protein
MRFVNAWSWAIGLLLSVDEVAYSPYRKPVENDRTSPPPRSAIVAYRWPITIIALVLIVVGGVYVGLGKISPSALTTVNVTTNFLSSIPEVSRSKGGLLEVATATVPETFIQSDERYTAWGWLSLGENVSEIRAPVTYRYHIKLAGEWDIRISGQICRVVAPPIEPSLPPSVHTHQMQKRTERGWGRFDGGRQLEKLERAVTPTAGRMASDPLHLALVRDEGRKTVKEFVKTWLLRDRGWKDDEFHFVDVRFSDEADQLSLGVAPELKQ